MKPIKCPALRRKLTGLVVGIMAGLALSYAEYRVIDAVQTFAATDLIARSLDLRRVLDADAGARADHETLGAMANATNASRAAQRDRRQSGRL